MTLTLNDTTPTFPRFFNHQKQSKAAFAIRCKNRKHLYHYISTTYSIFSIFYGKKLAFSSGFLYLCTDNRKNSLLVPKVGHLWRPRLVLIDGKRRSSMKTTKWAENGFLGNCDSRNSQTQTEHDQLQELSKLQERLQHYKQVGESYSSPSTLQQSNPISLALSGPKVK